MIDVHCHLADNKFKEDLDDVIKSSTESGVEKFVVVAEFESQFEKVIEICKRYPDVAFAGIGVHPIQKRGKSVQMKHVAKVEQFLMEHEKHVICVGEVGLDHTTTQFKLTEKEFEEQERVFKNQIELAKHYDKPLNVHSRSAARRTIEVLREARADRVVLHAFDGSVEEAKLGVDAEYFFSVPPSFSRSENAKNVIESIPLHLLLLETDSPALGPEKGVKNLPGNVKISAEIVAEIKRISTEEVVAATSSNAQRLFRFPS